jgi:hypothetical protein
MTSVDLHLCTECREWTARRIPTSGGSGIACFGCALSGRGAPIPLRVVPPAIVGRGPPRHSVRSASAPTPIWPAAAGRAVAGGNVGPR